MSAATALDGRLVGGLRPVIGSRYKGPSLVEALEQVEIFTDHRPCLAVIDHGYRRNRVETTGVLISGARAVFVEKLRRRSIEPEISYMKTDGHLARCGLEGNVGDANVGILGDCRHSHRRTHTDLQAWLGSIIAVIRILSRSIQGRQQSYVAP